LPEVPALAELKTSFHFSEADMLFAAWLLFADLAPAQYQDFFKQVDPALPQNIPTVDTVARLSTPTAKALQKFLNTFPHSAMVQWGLIQLHAAPGQTTNEDFVVAQPWWSHWFQQPPAAGELPTVPLPFTAFLKLLPASQLRFPDDDSIPTPDGSALLLSGGFQERRAALVGRISQKQRHQPAYEVQAFGAAAAKEPLWRESLGYLTLVKGILYWEGAAPTLQRTPWLFPLLQSWRKLGANLLVFGDAEIAQLPVGLEAEGTHHLELSALSAKGAKSIWEQSAKRILGTNTIDWSVPNRHYNLNLQCIDHTLRWTAEAVSKFEDSPTLQQVQANYVATSPMDLAGLAQRVVPSIPFADLALQSTTQASLQQLSKAFGQRTCSHPKGPNGMLAVFTGGPGTGYEKTPSALGNQLGLPVYRVNASALAKDLAKGGLQAQEFMKMAKAHTALLWLENAESWLYGANADKAISHFLVQQLPAANCLGVITTSLWKAGTELDRLADRVVEFPDFTLMQRVELAQKVLREMDMQLSPAINLSTLFKSLAVNGGTLTKVIHQAARLACQKGQTGTKVISLSDLQTAIQWQSR
ncbi:MAG: hypothetical protein ACFB10_24770, partial [Salibacteraceae bacterium]